MFYYSQNESANPARNYGSDAAQRFLALNGARFAKDVEGPDYIGCYLVTLDNGDTIEISRGERIASQVEAKLNDKDTICVPAGAMLTSRSAIKRWLAVALLDNYQRKAAADAAAVESAKDFA